MPKIPGNGGYAVLADGGPAVRIDNSDYEYEYTSLNDDVTDSASGGVAQGLPCLAKLESITLTVIDDSNFYVQALGLVETNVIPQLWLRRGAAPFWDLVQNTIVRSIRTSNPQDARARRLTVTCEYGSLTRNVVAPAGFT